MAPSTHGTWGITAGCLELRTGHQACPSPDTNSCSHRHREIQHICDPEGAECQEHDHRCAGEPAQLGTGFHVVSDWSCTASPPGTLLVPPIRTLVSSGAPLPPPSAPCPPISFVSKALPKSSYLPLSGATSLRSGLPLQSASCNLFFSRQPQGYF